MFQFLLAFGDIKAGSRPAWETDYLTCKIMEQKTKNIKDALVDIQSRLKAPKSQTNNFGHYNYRSAEDILEAVKPLLKENGCSLIISDDIVMVGSRTYIKATAKLYNGDSITTTAFAREEESKKGMDVSQVTGTASSYARKYALNGLFCIDDTKDADALNTSVAYTQKAQPTQNISGLLLAAKGDAANVNSRESFGKWWAKYPNLKQNQEFLKLAQELGKKYPKTAK